MATNDSNDPNNLTVRVLVEIRDEIRQTRNDLNQRIDETNARVDRLGDRLDGSIDSLTQRVIEGEIRTATALTGVMGAVHDVRDLLRDHLDLRDRVERYEHDIADLKAREN